MDYYKKNRFRFVLIDKRYSYFFVRNSGPCHCKSGSTLFFVYSQFLHNNVSDVVILSYRFFNKCRSWSSLPLWPFAFPSNIFVINESCLIRWPKIFPFFSLMVKNKVIFPPTWINISKLLFILIQLTHSFFSFLFFPWLFIV